jgi:CubicO group peptidase (beta-lactamase class C family)
MYIDNTITDFMIKYDIPGSSVAIVKDGRLVFSKGYGFANESTGELVDTNSLFRIASISKSITSVAIMKLVEEGKVSLSEKVFGKGGALGTQYGSLPYSNYEKAITIEHLLTHTAGGKAWNNSYSFFDSNADPMSSNRGMSQSDLIGWVLDTREPSELPGTAYSYSNFGYSVLGRVIEAKTNKTYESYVQNNILKPMGIETMRIGGDSEAERYPNEVAYYDRDLFSNPYGSFIQSMEVRRMDAHGGWIASATDLTRFMVHVDGFSTKKDFLQKASIKTMTTTSHVYRYYSKGWAINTQKDWFHTGSLPGSSSMLVRANDGVTWVFLANTRKGDGFFRELDKMMRKAVNDVSSWPNVDLF